MGLTLEAYEHPLKQDMGSALGVLTATIFALLGFFISPFYGLPLATTILFFGGCVYMAKLEKNAILHTVVWNASVLVLIGGFLYFVRKIFLGVG